MVASASSSTNTQRSDETTCSCRIMQSRLYVGYKFKFFFVRSAALREFNLKASSTQSSEADIKKHVN